MSIVVTLKEGTVIVIEDPETDCVPIDVGTMRELPLGMLEDVIW